MHRGAWQAIVHRVTKNGYEWSNLACTHTHRYNYRSIYMNATVSSNQKYVIDTQKLKRKEHKHTIKGNNQSTRQETKRRNELRRTTKTLRKQVLKWNGNPLQYSCLENPMEGRRSLVGYSPWGPKDGHNWETTYTLVQNYFKWKKCLKDTG